MKKTISIIGITAFLVALTMAMFADTVPFDSAKLYTGIVGTANPIIKFVIDATPSNPYTAIIGGFFIYIGGFITSRAIGFFKRRNAKK